MKKKRLDEHFKHSDYGTLKIRTTFRKHPFKEIVNDSGEYHKQKAAEARKRLKRLSGMKLGDYLRHMPEKLCDLSMLPAFFDHYDIVNMSVLEAFRIIGKIDDLSRDYSRQEAVFDACRIMLQPVIKSGCSHPLFDSLLKHNMDAAWQHLHDDRCVLGENSRKLLTISMNEYVKRFYGKSPEACASIFFNHVVIPAIVLDLPRNKSN